MAICLKYLQLSLIEFNANYVLSEVFLDQYVYKEIRPLIKLWQNRQVREELIGDELFNTFASFHDYINKILAKKLNINIVVYLEEILIYIENLK